MDRRTFVLLTGATSGALIRPPARPIRPIGGSGGSTVGRLKFELDEHRHWSVWYYGDGPPVPLIKAAVIGAWVADQVVTLADLEDSTVGNRRPPGGESVVVRGRAAGVFLEAEFLSSSETGAPQAAVTVTIYPDRFLPTVRGIRFFQTPHGDLLAGDAPLVALVNGYHSWSACRTPVVPATAEEGLVSHGVLGLTRALAVSAAARGAALLPSRPVTTLLLEGGRVAGVRAGPEILRASAVIEAMGAWSALLGGDPSPPPVEPVRGQIVSFDVPGHLSHVVCTPRGYIVPRADGRLLAGSTLERAGYEKNVTPAGLETVLRIAVEIAPGLANMRVADSWAGLRPGTPDHLPIVGPGAAPGFFHATGLYRNGILLGPLLGEAVARMALGADPGIDLAAFSPARFRSA